MENITALSLGGYTAPPGSKAQGYIEITPEVPKIPVSLINGAHPGKKILITAGVHGNEYPGILAAAEVANAIDPLRLYGQLVILHLVNGGAFYERLPALVPADGKNINRVFPGKADGTAAEKIAYFIAGLMGDNFDFYLDLHSGDLHEDLLPHLYYSELAKPEIIKASQEAAQQVAVYCMVHSQSPCGSLAAAAQHDLPALLIERGGRCIWNDEDEYSYRSDLYRLLKYWRMYEDGIYRHPVPHVHVFGTSRPLVAGADGFWKPLIKPGDKMLRGQVIGYITDAFGHIREAVSAAENGINLYQLSALSVRKGDLLLYCAVEPRCHLTRHEENHQSDELLGRV